MKPLKVCLLLLMLVVGFNILTRTAPPVVSLDGVIPGVSDEGAAAAVLKAFLRPGAYALWYLGFDPDSRGEIIAAALISWWAWLTGARLVWSGLGRLFGFYSISKFHPWLKYAGEAQAFLHRALGDAETRRYVGDGRAFINERAKCLEFVRRVHRLAHRVLGETDFRSVRVIAEYLAWHLEVGSDPAILLKKPESLKSSRARDDGVFAAFVFPHDEGLQQAVRGDGGREFGQSRVAPFRLAHIAIPGDEFAQADVLMFSHLDFSFC
jgi:hypothetical protein